MVHGLVNSLLIFEHFVPTGGATAVIRPSNVRLELSVARRRDYEFDTCDVRGHVGDGVMKENSLGSTALHCRTLRE